MSPFQGELWRHAKQQGTMPVWQIAVRLEGTLDLLALRRAVQSALRQNEILRLRIEATSLSTVPLIFAEEGAAAALTLLDLTNNTEKQSRSILMQRWSRSLERGIDIQFDPAIRFELFQLSQHTHVLHVVASTLCSDLQSLNSLLDQVATIYGTGKITENELPQYLDVAGWETQIAESANVSVGREYWREYLDKSVGYAKLPFETVCMNKGVAQFPNIITLKVRDERLSSLVCGLPYDRSMQSTLIAWLWLIHSHRASEGDMVELAIDARTHGLPAEALGPLTRVVPLRTTPRQCKDLHEWMFQLQHDIEQHRECARFWNESARLRYPCATSISRFEAYDLQWTQTASDLTFAICDAAGSSDASRLTLRTVHFDGAFEAELSFDGNRFSDLAAHLIVKKWQDLLLQILKDPGKKIGELELMGEEEREKVVVEWNRTEREYREGATLGELFEEQVKRTPEGVAVSSEGEELSYEELNRRANRLAHYLRDMGVGEEVRVGLCMERSAGMVVGILGVLKAGGAYVPLDPEYPAERLRFMLADSGAKVLLTEKGMKERLEGRGEEVQVVWMEELEQELEREGRETDPERVVEGRNAAYVIYTSGSTGRPKGVVVEHRQLSNYLQWSRDIYPLALGCGAPMHTSIAFDLTITSLFPVLLAGKYVQLLDHTAGVEALRKALAAHSGDGRFSVVKLTPSHLGVLCVQGLDALRNCATALVVGGESLPGLVVRKWRECDPNIRIFNEYGPTETTVGCCIHEVVDQLPSEGVPIGRPIANTQVYVLDEEMRVVPVGVIGELHIGGAGLARGYLGRAELTAERFVPNPYGKRAGERMYRTGDLARWRGDGNLEYVGRKDQQVKIRGYRIELGEIEAVLGEHGGVREAVVEAREGEGGEKRLVGYVVEREGMKVESGELRRYLQGRLPEYMVPGVIVRLERMPLTANGKVDRRNLPGVEGGEGRRGYEAPRGEVEELLAGIWEGVLGVERVGREDNFFELGGDSIKCITVYYQAKQKRVYFTLQNLYQFPTIARLAATVSASCEDAPHPVTAFQLLHHKDRSHVTAGIEDAYPLAALQSGMLFHCEMSEIPVYEDCSSMRCEGACNPEALHEALVETIARHEVLRTSFHLSGFSEPLQLVHSSVEPPLKVVDLRCMSSDCQQEVLEECFRLLRSKRIDWREPPLFTVIFHQLSDTTFQLTTKVHHAIRDGWSNSLLMQELFLRYLRHCGSPVVVEDRPLRSSYRDFIALEREIIGSSEARQFWVSKLDNVQCVRLARSIPSVASRSQPAAAVEVSVPERVSAGLRKVSHELGVSVRSVMLAAHLCVVSILCDRWDVVTGVVINGRPEGIDGERVLGLFLNTIPFRQNLRHGDTWVETIRKTAALELELLPFRRFPLAEIQQDLNLGDLFDCVFNFTDFSSAISQIGAIERLKIVESRFAEETNFALSAQFSANSAEGQGLQLVVDYRSERFSSDYAGCIGSLYESVLRAIAEDGGKKIGELALMGEEEREKVVVEWNRTEREYREGATLGELFEEQVKRTPEGVAVSSEGEELSYEELNRRANRLAHYLRDMGVGEEVRVGLCMERSAGMVVGILGVLKAGGAYVPLDPEYPAERLRFMLADSGAKVLLTEKGMKERLEGRGEEVQVVWMEELEQELEREGGRRIRRGWWRGGMRRM